jgi:hypothetical protein
VSPQTLQARPHLCGACESPIAPYRWAGNQHPTYGRQCNCPTPTSPTPVPDDALCFVTKDVSELRVPKPIGRVGQVHTGNFDQFRLEAGETVADLIAPLVEEARTLLRDGMKTADRHRDQPGSSFLHRRLAELISDIDDFRSIVAERSQS